MKTYEELKRENLGGQFPGKMGLAEDYINAWIGLGLIKSGMATADNESCWRKVSHYEEYIKGKGYFYAERIIADSDSKKIAEANELADEFNDIREQLKTAKDSKKAEEFFDRASLLIRGFKD